MSRVPFAKESVALLPEEPGVYLFFDARGRVVYVGKARTLRSRVTAYFGVGDHRLVSRLIADLATELDWILTGSEKDALLLENSLIKKHKPRLNIRLTDDKTYFSLRLDLKEPWPRLTIVRRRKSEDVLYFGPYPSAQSCRRTIQFLSSLFPIRTCPDSVLYNRSRPCLSYEIGRCTAPCVDYIARAEYMKIVDRLVRFLSGQDEEVVAELDAEMNRAAELLEFEKAAELRDRLKQMEATLFRPQVARRGGVDRDVLGLALEDQIVILTLLEVRDGVLTLTSTFRLKRLAEVDEVLAAFLGQFYSREHRPPPEILLPEECSDIELHRQILEERREGPVLLRVPERGEGLRLLRLAEQNAAEERRKQKDRVRDENLVLKDLQELLGLIHLPERIECFDISHLGGDHVVGSQVSFVEGVPNKTGYRHYRLRSVQRNDDFAAMEEVLTRRLRRGLDEHSLPDLIVIDGGRPQLVRVVQVLRTLKIDSVDVIGLAKARSSDERGTVSRYERAVLPDRDLPVVLEPGRPTTHLLQRARDEAHRFAISFSRRLRQKEKISTVLELIPGVGVRRGKALLYYFGSVEAVRGASEEQIAEAPGITTQLARNIVLWFGEHSSPLTPVDGSGGAPPAVDH